MSTFITTFETTGDGPRLAVKDIIDMVGVPTTGGSRALERKAQPAAADAACLAGARAAGARIVGKTNLHELATMPIGTNPWFGNPVNPLDPALIPGGSSSGSAVAVATDEADTAYGSDTGGSVRIPSACCGTAGLKTTYGRISLEGVWPLSTSLDTVGPMGRDLAGVVLGMQLLEPGFTPAAEAATVVGRLRHLGPDADPVLDEAVDRALAEAGFEVVDIELDWAPFDTHFLNLIVREAWQSDHELLETDPDGLSSETRGGLEFGGMLDDGMVAAARSAQGEWRRQVDDALARCQLLALPTLPLFPPEVGTIDGLDVRLIAHTGPFNFSGHPALALPVPSSARLPGSLQLVGPHGGEELLCGTGAVVEAAVA